MKVYLAYEGDEDKRGSQRYDLIGVFKDRNQAIKAIEETIVNYPNADVKRETDSSGNIWWIEYGMEMLTVGYLEVRDLL